MSILAALLLLYRLGRRNDRADETTDQMSEPTPYTFRSAVNDDLSAIIAMLADDSLGQSREDPKGAAVECYQAAFAAILSDPNNDMIVAVRDNQTVGCLQLTIIPGLSRSGMTRAQIESVRVASTERGHGLGRDLFLYAFEEARRRGADMVQLTTDKVRPDALRFYENLGFTASHEGMKLTLSKI